jgi:putative FmdB family regulatory protein
MPSYDFTCKVCGAKFERIVPFDGDASLVTCPNGHHQVRRLYTAPSVIFKGSGWYSTDHRKRQRTASASAAD